MDDFLKEFQKRHGGQTKSSTQQTYRTTSEENDDDPFMAEYRRRQSMKTSREESGGVDVRSGFDSFLSEHGYTPSERTHQAQPAEPAPVMQPAEDTRTPFQKTVDRILGADRTQVTGGKTNWWQALVSGPVRKGLNQWSNLNWKTLNDFLGGPAEEIHTLGVETINAMIDVANLIPGVDMDYIQDNSRNLLQWGAEENQKQVDYLSEKYAANANTSRAAQIVDQFGTSTVAAVPLAIEAVLLKPYYAAKAAVGTGTEGLQYFSALKSSDGLEAAGMMAKEGLTKLLKNPQFWTSYLQVAGDGYESALEEGMSEEDAAAYGLVNGFFNSMIEIGGVDDALGGIQNYPMRLAQMEEQQGKRAVVEWFKDTVLGEGLEEVEQGIMERGLMQAAKGDSIGDMFSVDPTDTEAAFNPITSLQEFTGGAVVGGLLGAGQTAISKGGGAAMNKIAENVQIREEQRQQQIRETGRRLVDQTLDNMDLSDGQKQVLSSGFETGETDAQTYAHGIQEAFRLGEQGLSFEQARENAVFAEDLNETQFRHAWEIGAQKGGNSVETGQVESAPVLNTPEYESIEELSREYRSPEKVTEIFDRAADTDVNDFAAGFRAAYDMGQSGVGEKYLTDENIRTLTEEQRRAAYELGRTDAAAIAAERAGKIGSQQKEGNLERAKGTVKGEGVTIADMKKAFNDSQNTAYRLLTRYAEASGVNIVLYNSQADEKTGQFPA
ncbi:MAG: hypothetical protein J5449_08145, partial [Oscillospiraceae bacterium]|nr:hypothetical protein [Oscillospiraceae bacterium]